MMIQESWIRIKAACGDRAIICSQELQRRMLPVGSCKKQTNYPLTLVHQVKSFLVVKMRA